MKVNIDGKGVLPGVGLLPVRGKDLSTDQILRLLNFNNVRIYAAGTGALITGPDFFKTKPVATVAKTLEPIKPVEVPVTVTEEKIAEPNEPLPEIPAVEPAPYVEPEIEVVPDEEIPMEIHVDAAPAEDVAVEVAIEQPDETETVEEAPAEEAEAPKQNNGYHPYNGKKKKRR